MDEVKETSKKIYEETGVVGFAVDSLTDLAQILIYQSHEGQIVDLKNKEVAFNDDKTLEWVEWCGQKVYVKDISRLLLRVLTGIIQEI